MVRADCYAVKTYSLKLVFERVSVSMLNLHSSAQITVEKASQQLNVYFSGSWNIAHTPPQVDVLLQNMQEPHVKRVVLYAQGLEVWDSSLLALVIRLVRHAKDYNVELDDSDMPEGLLKLMNMSFKVHANEDVRPKSTKTRFLSRFNAYLESIPDSFGNFLDFFGEICLGVIRFFQGKADLRTVDFWDAVEECGIKSLPIIALINILFGLILAFVGAIQLTQFGAESFVAPLVGIGMLRVMGAVMVGIIMSGRIGAAYAALIGTMQVNEEVDALKTFGISAVEFLVLPRMFALIFMAPLLTLYADLMGVFGGYLVGVFMLELSTQEYINATIQFVSFKQLVIGLIYGTTFGAIIAIAGCYQGIRCGRSAAAVGQATTAAVVTSIVGIIVATAVITIICHVLQV